MADRILVWHKTNGSVEFPRYYMEEDYEPTAIRIMSREAPGDDVVIDIFKDGVSILASTSELTGKETLQDIDDDFIDDPMLESGSVVTCSITNGNDITVQLELERMN